MNGNNQVTNPGFAFDAAGNATSDGSYNYTWDAEGRLKTAAGVTYTYDGDGQRVEKSSGTLYWFGVGGEVLEETGLAGNWTNDYIYFAGRRIGRIQAPGTVYLVYGDLVGSARAITDASGNLCYDADFYPFGGERVITNTCGQNYKFTGMERDSETGNDHTQFRQYASNLGRWLSPDPLGGNVLNPQSLNRYAYVNNNPLNAVDPAGLELVLVQLGDEEDDGGVGGGVAFYVDTDVLEADGFTISRDDDGNVTGISAPDGGANFIDSNGNTIGSVEGGADLNFTPVTFQDSVTVTASGSGTLVGSSASNGGIGGGGDTPGSTPGSKPGSTQPGTAPKTHFNPFILPGTNYCGPGDRGGAPTNGVDAACQQHDVCFANAGLSFVDALNPVPSKESKQAQAVCNRQLCENLSRNIFYSGQESANQLFVQTYFGCR